MSGSHDHHQQHDHHDHHHLHLALWLTALFALVELGGGLYSGSLALLADAGHMASDVVALAIAVAASTLAARPAHAGMTYGYGQVRILAAQFNGLLLWFLAGWIVWEAVDRLLHPPLVAGGVVMAIALLGLLLNLLILFWLHGGEELNTRAAYWHVLGDLLGSIAALLAGSVILFTGWMTIDPLLSFLVAAILAYGGWRLLRETTLSLLAGVPDGVDSRAIAEALGAVDGVRGVHHLHIWAIPNGETALSAHIECCAIEQWPQLLPRLQQALAQLGIDHATLQPEVAICSSVAGWCHHPD